MDIFTCLPRKNKMDGDIHVERISNKENTNFVWGNKLDFRMPEEFMDILLLVYNFRIFIISAKRNTGLEF